MSVNKTVSLSDYNLTPRAKKAFKDAQKFAKNNGDQTVNNIHVFYGCLVNSIGDIQDFLSSNYLTLDHLDFKEILKISREKNKDKFYSSSNSNPWHEELIATLKEANEISDDMDQYYIGLEHILLGIFNVSDYLSEYLQLLDVDVHKLKVDLGDLIAGGFESKTDEDSNNLIDLRGVSNLNKSLEAISKFTTNLNELALRQELRPVYGRDKEIDSLIEILSKKNKSNAILIGEAGVGKTAIIEGLALKICQGEVPSNMLAHEIYNVDLGRMVAGTRYRGDFEAKFQMLLETVKQNDNIILFFDEIHNIFGAGNSDGILDASNMLKPALARGDIKCIGATTTNEYQKIFEKDSAMKRRFEAIDISEPTKEQVFSIIYNSIESFEQFHNVKYSKSIIEYIIDCCEKFLPHKRFPDKAFDILDQIGSRVKISQLKPPKKLVDQHNDILNLISADDSDPIKLVEIIKNHIQDIEKYNSSIFQHPFTVKKKDVESIISEHSKISISEIQNSSKQFDKFYKNISNEIFGQDENLQKINDILSCCKIGLYDENKPLASFFFAGPTSVGKTYTAKKIAKYFYGNEKAFIQINMSELQDETGIAKLIGANAGYIGHEEGGYLTNFVRNNPNCVVLFDEIEKSNPKILNLLLHLLDEGYLMDNLNRKVAFNKTIVILTSNIGSQESSKTSIGFVQDATPQEDTYHKTLKNQLRPELLARINELIIFNQLNDKSLLKIIDFEMETFKQKLKNQKIDLKISKSFSADFLFLIKKENAHARQIKDLVKQRIIIPTARFIVSNPKKSQISIKYLDSKLNIK